MRDMNLVQDESEPSSNIKANLIELNSCFNFTFSQISKLVGVSESFLSRVLNGKAEGGRQLDATLKILIQLETLKRETQETLALRSAIRKIALPEREFAMNEPANFSKTESAQMPVAPIKYKVPAAKSPRQTRTPKP